MPGLATGELAWVGGALVLCPAALLGMYVRDELDTVVPPGGVSGWAPASNAQSISAALSNVGVGLAFLGWLGVAAAVRPLLISWMASATASRPLVLALMEHCLDCWLPVLACASGVLLTAAFEQESDYAGGPGHGGLGVSRSTVCCACARRAPALPCATRGGMRWQG